MLLRSEPEVCLELPKDSLPAESLLQSCADERLEVRVRAALVLGVRGEDLADGLQECLDTVHGMSIT